MASRKARQLRRDQAQYSVYIYHPNVQQNESQILPMDWERRHKTFSLRSALRNAEKLYNSRAYERVEIRKVSFNKRMQRRIDKQLKIYKKKSDRPVGMLLDLIAAVFEGIGYVFVGAARAYVSVRTLVFKTF